MSYVIKTAKTIEEAVEEALKELNIKKEDSKIEILQQPSRGFLGFGSKEAAVKVSKKEDTKDIIKEIFNSDLESEKSKNIKKEKKSSGKSTKNVEQKKEKFEDKKKNIQQKKENKQDLKKHKSNNSKENKQDLKKSKIDEVKENNSEKEFTENSLSKEKIESLTREFMKKTLNSLQIEYDLDIEIEDHFMKVNILGDENKMGIVIGKRGVTLDAIQYILGLIINRHSDRFIRVIVDSSGYRKKRENTLQKLSKKMAKKVLKTGKNIRLDPMTSHERKIIHESLHDFKGIITHSEGKDPYRRVIIQKERKY